MGDNPASNGFLMSNHGAFCLDKTDKEAFIISKELPLRECAILRNKGIVCHASTDDINALSIVVEKQCQAAYLAHILGDINPISPENVMTDRKKYVLSYSKLK